MMATPKTGKKPLAIALFGLGTFFGLSFPTPALAVEFENDIHSLTVSTRARLAQVEAKEDARSASILVRASLESEWQQKLLTLLEIDHVELGWEDEFDNGVNFNGKPVIPDVAGSDLNQAWLRYSVNNRLTLTLGREAVNLGNQRFVGTNSFWQNEQTLDGAQLKFDFASASSLHYRYVANANRINGEDATDNGTRPAQFLGDHKHQTHVVFAQFKEWDFSKLQAYYFNMDIEDANALSNETLGIRYEHKGRINKLRTLGHAEFASQQRPKANDDATLLYYSIGAGLGYRSNEISLKFEALGEDKGTAFVTPLASLHEHNGWADMFLLTPSYGLRDYSVKYIWRKNPFTIDARFHLFQADKGSRTLGQELDIDLEYNLTKKDKILFRYADFKSKDSNLSDEKRLFLMYSHQM